MDVYEITDYKTGVDNSGVNYLSPSDSFENLQNGFIYRQVLQSRQGVGFFAPRLAGETRIMGIFEFIKPDSTSELLVFDKNFLYKFDTGSGQFVQIPFAGSLAAYTGFNITSNDDYISGTAYPTATNGPRFVFCGSGITPNAGSAIFFYNGTDVRNFTSVVDNPNYAAPPGGALNSATYVLWFNERLNFIVPVIAGIEYNQGTLYSGIRTASGNGDKFNVAGSGLFQADTYQYITGATILGQIMVHNYDRMAYTMEKTRDAFNPYFGRAIPGVLGTSAKFSAISWNDQVASQGKTGVLGADGRQNLRIDNKIPRFTANEIDQMDFNLTYGGFDRLNNQFLWSYKKSETDSDTQNSVLVRNYEENTWSVYDQRFSVFGQTDIGLNLNWDDIDGASGNSSWSQWDTTEEIWDKIGLGAAVQKTLAGDNLGFVYELNQSFDDYFTNISAITTGNTTTLTVDATGVLAGDLLTISNVQGMVEINNFDPATNTQLNNFYEVISATPTSIEINVDSTLFSPYIPNTGNLSKIISFSAQTIPFNPYRSEGKRVYISHVDFTIDVNGGSLLVDVIADQQSGPFIQNVLLKPKQDSEQICEIITMSVNQEANFLTFILKQQSPAVQLRLTSMKLYCERGGLING